MGLQGKVNEVQSISGSVAAVPAGYVPGGTVSDEQIAKAVEEYMSQYPGIHVGSDEPTDENIVVWINPDAENTSVLVEAPATAKIGQTHVVKEVDENGVPIKWEAADLPDSYTKSQIDTIMGAYINDIDALIGGDG